MTNKSQITNSKQTIILNNQNLEKKGFTLIEIVIGIVLLAIIMLPLGMMAMEYMRGIVYSRELGIVENLAKVEMAKINNLAYNDTTLADGYNATTSSYEGYPYDLRRVVSDVAGWSSALRKVEVDIYHKGDTTNSLVNLITYVADVSFGSGSGGGAVTTGGQANFLLVADGEIFGTQLRNLTLQNISTDPIIIEGITILYTGVSGIKLNTITMDSLERWSGTHFSGQAIEFDTNFTLDAETTYTHTGVLDFSKNVTSVTILIFLMGDASESGSYSW